MTGKCLKSVMPVIMDNAIIREQFHQSNGLGQLGHNIQVAQKECTSLVGDICL